MKYKEILSEVLKQYQPDEGTCQCEPYGNGHINSTFLLTVKDGEKEERFILQKINQNVFHHPEEVMENVENVTGWLAQKIRLAGGDEKRETLHVVRTVDGKNCYQDSEGQYWRVYTMVEDTVCLETIEEPEDFYRSAQAFGKFQRMLADFPAEKLYETIPDFHNTEKRFAHFEEVVKADVCGRVKDAEEEIRLYMERKPFASALSSRNLPLRVTHNDTKLNNVLFDQKTGNAICVIDLDTVMPGLAVNDFGDSIRFGANTAVEDEQDLSKVSLDLNLFEAFTKGFVEECGQALTKEELEMLPVGAMMMTFECGMRFLSDHLEGDVYFKIHRENHNLDRARTQLKLLLDMEAKRPIMDEIVKKYC